MKKVKLFIVVTILINMFVQDIHADVGPKPSVNITFENAPDNLYFVTLLSKTKVMGPWHEVSDEDINRLVSPEYDAFKAFMEIKDDYYFLNYVEECSDDDTFSWSYYPPNDFKIAIYDVKSKKVVVSEELSRLAFDSYYVVNYNLENLSVKEEIRIGKKLWGFLFRVLVTIVIELLIGLLFGYRSKMEIKTIVIVNIITQVLLNLILLFLDYYNGYLVWLIFFPILEIIVLIIEMIIYLFKFKNHKRFKTIIYVIIANILSFLVGIYSSMFFY